VKEAEDGDALEPGLVLVAPGGKNLLARKKGDRAVAILADRGDEDKYVPSVNALFNSGATAFADKSLAVVLTGMGNDGSEGVVAIKTAGGQVLAESEKTSIVFGMPREAIATQKVDEVLNLEDIPRGILRRTRTR
jgi:two-component system, chemotaxis family, protein-glutamate methylesterase/glutaminase